MGAVGLGLRYAADQERGLQNASIIEDFWPQLAGGGGVVFEIMCFTGLQKEPWGEERCGQ